MNKSVAVATLFGCLAGGCMGSTVRIMTDGVFENGTRVSNGGVIFDGTNSFEQVTARAHAIFNLGLFLGTTNTDKDTFTLTLQQADSTGGPVVVGTWKAHLRGNTLQFEPHLLQFSDGGYEYIWGLTQHQYDVSAANMPINAELVMIDSASLTASLRQFRCASVALVSAASTRARVDDGYSQSRMFPENGLPLVADAYLPDVIVRRIRDADAQC